MKLSDVAAVEAFIDSHARDWRQIARATHGDHEEEDVASIARLACIEQTKAAGSAINWRDPTVQKTFITHLHCKLVKFTERLHRGAVRLDHAPPGSDFDRHPLAERLVAHGGDPVALLMAAEEMQDERALVDRAHTLMAAYVRLMRHYRNDVGALADYLLVSRQ